MIKDKSKLKSVTQRQNKKHNEKSDKANVERMLIYQRFYRYDIKSYAKPHFYARNIRYII